MTFSRGVSTSKRIKMVLDRLRQRYGVFGGFVTEPKIIEICNRPATTFRLYSFKQFNEDLNMLEIFAYAQYEYEKLSGQLLLNVAGDCLELQKC